MRGLRSFFIRLTGLFRRDHREREMSDEFESLLDLHVEDNLRAGMSREEARREAMLRFGSIASAKESYRDAASLPFLENLARDLRYGLRTLRGSPGFTIAAVLLLALGIGANTSIYSFMDAILLRSLPVKDPQSLMLLNWQAKENPPVKRSHTGETHREPDRGIVSGNLPFRAFEFLRANNQVFTSTFGFFNGGDLTILVNGHAERSNCEFVSGNYFSGLGVPPAMGRLMDNNDEPEGAADVAVLSHAYWQSRFGQSADIIGQTILVNNIPFTVIGVAPPEFFGVDPGVNPQIYLPIRLYENIRADFSGNPKSMYQDDNWYWIRIMGRLKPGITMQRAEAELAASFSAWVSSTATSDNERTNLPLLYLQAGSGGLDLLRVYYSKPLYVLMAMTGLILAIACANIANLLLARATARRREIATRLALGASRWRVTRQLLTESALLSVLGGAFGVLFAIVGIRGLSLLLANWQPETSFRAELNWSVLAVTITLAIVIGMLFGLAPAIQSTQVRLTPGLNENRTGAPSRWRHFFHGNGLRGALVATQIALSLLLLAGAGLFLRTLANLQSVNRGFNEENILLFQVNAKQAGYQDKALASFYTDLRERLLAIPGVRDVTMMSYAMVSGSRSRTMAVISGTNTEGGTAALLVGPNFLKTMQIPLVLGRDIENRDMTSVSPGAVINEAFASKYFPGVNPVGRSFRFGNREGVMHEVVGVAKNALLSSLKEPIEPTVYIPHSQNLARLRQMTFSLRIAGDPMMAAAPIRQIAGQMDSRIPVTNIKTQTAQIQQTIGRERLFAALCSVFAILGLAIAAVGVYGTLAYSVSRRTGEIGIRMALGAQRRRVVAMILRESLVIIATGLAIGLPVAWLSSRLIESLVFGVKPTDPETLAAAGIILLIAAVIAAFLPAWRASTTEPMSALRHE